MCDSAIETRRLVVTTDDVGKRLDRYLSRHVADLSRQRVKALIKDGCVRIDGGNVCDPNKKVVLESVVEIDVPPAANAVPAGEAIALSVVYEDNHLIVVDKPAGLVTHPAPGNESGTLVNALIAHCGDSLSGIGGVRRPGIVHRLDKDTSGLIVVAKSDVAHRGLAEQFQAHGSDGRLRREYVALVWGEPDQPHGTINAPLGRSPTNRRKMAIVREQDGRRAVTHYRVEERFFLDNGSLVSSVVLQLETGRTHQIRVHMASIGHPLLGDKVYGAGFKASERRLSEAARDALCALDRQALHARLLGFEHPVTGDSLQFESPLPDDINAVRAALAGSLPAVPAT